MAVVLILLAGTMVALWAGEAAKLRRAPSFVLRDWQNQWVRSADYKGKVIALEFIQTTCPGCHTTTQVLRHLYDRYKDRGFAVILVSHDEQKEKVIKPFAEFYSLNFPILVGDLGIAVRYIGITPQNSSFPVPYLFLIDRQGYIVGEYNEEKTPGFFKDEEANLEKEVVRLLEQQPAQKKAGPAGK